MPPSEALWDAVRPFLENLSGSVLGAHLNTTISYLELVWTLVAVVGSVYSWAGLAWAQADCRYLREAGVNGLLQDMAAENVRVESNRRFIHVMMVTIGFLAMLIPPRPDQHAFAGVITVGVLLAIEVRLVASTIMAFSFKKRFQRRVQERIEQDRVAAIIGGRRRDDRKHDDLSIWGDTDA